MRWTGQAVFTAVDPDRIRDTIAHLIRLSRELDVRDGALVHPVTGEPMPRLRVDSGRHPVPGTVYEATTDVLSERAATAFLPYVRVGDRSLPTDAPEAQAFLAGLSRAPRTRRSLIELVSDGHGASRLAGVDAVTAWHVTVERPAHISRLTLDARIESGSTWWTRGELIASSWADVEAIARGDREVAGATVRHPRLRGSVDIDVVQGDRRWNVHARVHLRGKGVARPLGGLFSLFIGRHVRKELDESFEEISRSVEAAIAELNGSESASDLALRILVARLEPYAEPASDVGPSGESDPPGRTMS